MSERRFTEKHEWLDIDDDLVTIGITDHAQNALGDIVFVELPDVGATLAVDEEMIVIESVKAAGEVSSPLDGTVEAVNDALADAPETINSDPLGDGWLIKVRVEGALDLSRFMDADAYNEFIAE